MAPLTHTQTISWCDSAECCCFPEDHSFTPSPAFSVSCSWVNMLSSATRLFTSRLMCTVALNAQHSATYDNMCKYTNKLQVQTTSSSVWYTSRRSDTELEVPPLFFSSASLILTGSVCLSWALRTTVHVTFPAEVSWSVVTILKTSQQSWNTRGTYLTSCMFHRLETQPSSDRTAHCCKTSRFHHPSRHLDAQEVEVPLTPWEMNWSSEWSVGWTPHCFHGEYQ